MFRVDGSLVPLKDGKRLPPEEVARMAFGIMNEYQRDKFKNSNEVDLAYGVPGLGRFRVNVFQQRGTLGAVLRVIPFNAITIRAPPPRRFWSPSRSRSAASSWSPGPPARARAPRSQR